MRIGHCVLLVPVFLPWCQPAEREPAPESVESVPGMIVQGLHGALSSRRASQGPAEPASPLCASALGALPAGGSERRDPTQSDACGEDDQAAARVDQR